MSVNCTAVSLYISPHRQHCFSVLFVHNNFLQPPFKYSIDQTVSQTIRIDLDPSPLLSDTVQPTPSAIAQVWLSVRFVAYPLLANRVVSSLSTTLHFLSSSTFLPLIFNVYSTLLCFDLTLNPSIRYNSYLKLSHTTTETHTPTSVAPSPLSTALTTSDIHSSTQHLPIISESHSTWPTSGPAANAEPPTSSPTPPSVAQSVPTPSVPTAELAVAPFTPLPIQTPTTMPHPPTNPTTTALPSTPPHPWPLHLALRATTPPTTRPPRPPTRPLRLHTTTQAPQAVMLLLAQTCVGGGCVAVASRAGTLLSRRRDAPMTDIRRVCAVWCSSYVWEERLLSMYVVEAGE